MQRNATFDLALSMHAHDRVWLVRLNGGEGGGVYVPSEFVYYLFTVPSEVTSDEDAVLNELHNANARTKPCSWGGGGGGGACFPGTFHILDLMGCILMLRCD